MESKKEQILYWLNKIGRMPTSKIGILVGLPSAYALKYLEELRKSGKVIKIEETNATYWEIVK